MRKVLQPWRRQHAPDDGIELLGLGICGESSLQGCFSGFSPEPFCLARKCLSNSPKFHASTQSLLPGTLMSLSLWHCQCVPVCGGHSSNNNIHKLPSSSLVQKGCVQGLGDSSRGQPQEGAWGAPGKERWALISPPFSLLGTHRNLTLNLHSDPNSATCKLNGSRQATDPL